MATLFCGNVPGQIPLVCHRVGRPCASSRGLAPFLGPPDGHAVPLMNSLISAVIRQDRDFVNDGKHKANEGMGEGNLRVPHCSTPLPARWQQAAWGEGSRNPPTYPTAKRQGSTPYGGKTEEGSTCGLSPKAVGHNPQGKFSSPPLLWVRTPTPVASGSFFWEEGKGARMWVPRQTVPLAPGKG